MGSRPASLQFPCFPSTVPESEKEISNDSRCRLRRTDIKVLGDVLDWATNVGYPGYATAAIDEAFKSWVIPTMFATVASGRGDSRERRQNGGTEYKRIFETIQIN